VHANRSLRIANNFKGVQAERRSTLIAKGENVQSISKIVMFQQ